VRDEAIPIDTDEVPKARIGNEPDAAAQCVQDADAARDLAARLHGEGPAVLAPDEVRDPRLAESLVGPDRVERARGRFGAVESASPDTEVGARPPIHAELVQVRAIRRDRGGPDDVDRGDQRPGTAARHVDERELRLSPIIRADQRRAAERTGCE
jgi:hypothetical protein